MSKKWILYSPLDGFSAYHGSAVPAHLLNGREVFEVQTRIGWNDLEAIYIVEDDKLRLKTPAEKQTLETQRTKDEAIDEMIQAKEEEALLKELEKDGIDTQVKQAKAQAKYLKAKEKYNNA